MIRLFVAIGLPSSATAELARLQPEPMAGVKLISQTQMHLTLHFIGDAPVPAVTAALQLIRARAFSIRFAALGSFRVKDGGVILWVGIEHNEALAELRNAIVTALSSYGLVVANGQNPLAFQPHVTLAKCKRQVPVGSLDSLADRRAVLHLPDVAISQFSLYSSATDMVGVQYRIEHQFPLYG
jgi:2'-5' RNA ligase